MKRRILVIGGLIALVFALLCGFGGYALYRSINDTAKELGPEFKRAEKNKIPLYAEDLRPEPVIPPKDNAALLYKKVFDEWSALRPEIDDQRWQSFVATTAQNEDTAQVAQFLYPILPPFRDAVQKDKAYWQIDYSDRAFSSYPVFAAVVDAAIVDLKSTDKILEPQSLEKILRASTHILDSHDPNSLRASAAIRTYALQQLANELPKPQNWKNQGIIDAYLEMLESTPDIDPLPVWRTTAFLQLDTWENYDKLTEEQQELFAAARRDHDVIINAASTEILKFWNTAIQQSEGKPALTQYITLAESVRLLRERTDPAANPLIKLWSLDSATKGAGSLDWILANEQLQLIRQALDVLAVSSKQLPTVFECKRISVIGQKPYTYEKTATGFKLSATPSDILAPDSALAQQSLVYEFVSR